MGVAPLQVWPLLSQSTEAKMHDSQPRIARAATIGDIKTLRALYDIDPGAFTKGSTSEGPVHLAARWGHLESVQFLVKECGVIASTRTGVGSTAAHDAGAAGKCACLKWLIENTNCQLDDRDGEGATVLHLAARYGHLLVLKWLVADAGARIEDRTQTGATPLHFASANGHLDAVKFLVENSPSLVNQQLECGATAAYLAAQDGHLEVFRYLAEEGGASLRVLAFDGMSCLHAAAQMGQLACVQWLIESHEFSVNEKDYDGMSSLHFACGWGQCQVVSWLLEHGAPPMGKDNAGSTPLHEAAQNGHLACVRLLIQKGCSTSATDGDGLTAQQLADLFWQAECAAQLKTKSKEKSYQSLVALETMSDGASSSSCTSGDYCSLPKGKLSLSEQPPEDGYFTNSSDTSSRTMISKISIGSQTDLALLAGDNRWNAPFSAAPPLPPPLPPHAVPPPPPPPPPAAPPPPPVFRTSGDFSSLKSTKDSLNIAASRLKNSQSVPKLTNTGISMNPSPSMDLIAELKAASRASTLKRENRRKGDGTKESANPKEEIRGNRIVFSKPAPAVHKKPTTNPVEKAKLTGEFDPINFLSKVNEKNNNGIPIPDWKKMILARQMAEKAYKESEELRQKEEQDNKWKNMPPWKRALIEKKQLEKAQQGVVGS